uniref:RBPJ-interacting and tubulin-associated protein 1 n=1 Tax=Xenopus laevis TaxID=8355 RepID=RITA1_XENLA|nr:RecName: Full=RBPJ-interacting and tubulin-associated protein 1; AltName: Full=RBPJ-interacting and tubulin-associated protein [Xenopus laevis]
MPDNLYATNMSLDLSITGHSTALPQRKSRSTYRFKAANSYVDESLFGSSGVRVDQTLQWNTAPPSQTPLLWSPGEIKENKKTSSCRPKSTPAGTPRKKIQYRVKSRTPSYCDESLFGGKVEECTWDAPWVKKEDTVKIRPLLWSPSPRLVQQSSMQNAKQGPLRAVHPPETSDSPLGTHKGLGAFWKPPESDSDYSPSPFSARQRQSTPGRETVRSASCSGRVTARRGSVKMQERPPWK